MLKKGVQMKYYMIVYGPFAPIANAFVAEAIDEDFFDEEFEVKEVFNQTWCEGSFKKADTLEGCWDYTIILASSSDEALEEFLKYKNCN